MNQEKEEKRRPVTRTLVLRLAIMLTALAVTLALALLIKETAYVFSVFMFVGPVLLLVAILLLGYVIFTELRSKQVI
jgi:small-conductance mechanosensitive channel